MLCTAPFNLPHSALGQLKLHCTEASLKGAIERL